MFRTAPRLLRSAKPIFEAEYVPIAQQFHRPAQSHRRFQGSHSRYTSSKAGADVTVRHDQNTTTFTWPSSGSTTFDNQFLLDHCRCHKCFHPQTKQRLKTLLDLPAAPQVRSLEVLGEDAKITWNTSDGHESVFPLAFIRKAAYNPPLISPPARERVLWNKRIAQSPPTASGSRIMDADSRDSEVLRLLDQVHDFGFCYVSDIPIMPEGTEEIIRTIAPIRETHYGGFWDFTANMSHGDLAYSTESLPAHTDTTYFTDPAGLQIFHKLSHPPPGEGGISLLVDGFYVASLLKELHPKSYDTLSRLSVPAHASGTNGTLLRPFISQPVLRHDEAGELAQVRWNNEDRGVLGRFWSPQDVRDWYTAARDYERLIRSEDAEYWAGLQPGAMLDHLLPDRDECVGPMSAQMIGDQEDQH